MKAFATIACLLAVNTVAAQVPTISEQASGTRSLLQAVSAVDANVVWVSGHRGAVLRTVDGGTTWEAKPVAGADSLEFRDVHAFSKDVAWLLSAGPGARSRIYHTKNGGKSWALQFTNADSAAFYDCFTFFDKRRGVAYSDAAGGRTLVLRTDNGGRSWRHVGADRVPAPLEGEGAFAASGGCLTSHGSSRAWVTTGSPEARVLRTVDAGKSWTAFPTPFVKGDGAGMSAASFRNEKVGIGVGARMSPAYARDTAAAAVAMTDDGGMTWTLRSRPSAPGALFGVAWVPGATGETAVTSAISGLWFTRDGAGTWVNAAPFAHWSVGAFGRRAWGVGPGGRITRLEF